MRISFIGCGNVAWHMAPELENAGHKVGEVYSRTIKNAKALSSRLYEANPVSSLDFSDSHSELFIISVPDDALEEVLKEVIFPAECTAVHTSGSQSLDVFGYIPISQYGVFYPLQTFSKAKRVAFDQIPILIESEDKATKKLLLQLAKSISKNVREVNSADRHSIHVSAVFACNFTNHMFTIASDLLQEKDIDFTILKPLIVETINKCLAIGPKEAQTGPAKRHDMDLLEKHMEFLSERPEESEIYKVITQHIINTYPE